MEKRLNPNLYILYQSLEHLRNYSRNLADTFSGTLKENETFPFSKYKNSDFEELEKCLGEDFLKKEFPDEKFNNKNLHYTQEKILSIKNKFDKIKKNKKKNEKDSITDFRDKLVTTFRADLNDRESSQYHQNIKSLLNTYIKSLIIKPDIIVLGEYTPLQEDNGKKEFIAGYKLLDFAKVKDGTRGMTVLTLKDSKSWNRITVHDRQNGQIDHGNENTPSFEKNRIEKYYNNNKDNYTVLRNNWKTKLLSAIDDIGEYVEIMYKNRYIALAHVKGCGKDAKENAIKVLTSGLKHMHLAGDLNVGWKKKLKNHKHRESKFLPTGNNSYSLEINTNSRKILDHKKIYKEDLPHILQSFYRQQTKSSLNIRGKTASGNVAHDGIYIKENKKSKDELEILGSLWPILPFKNYYNDNKFNSRSDCEMKSTTYFKKYNMDIKDDMNSRYYQSDTDINIDRKYSLIDEIVEYKVESDHKGFLLSLKIDSSVEIPPETDDEK